MAENLHQAPPGRDDETLDRPRRPYPRAATIEHRHGTISRIGRYEIVKLLGKGGMGRVFLAKQEQPIRRQVAVKLIHTSLSSVESVARFSAERQAMARLDHPNVAHIFDGGTTQDGYPFCVMEYVPGVAIKEYCDDRRLTIDERVGLFVQACEGVKHAHLKQLLHRDLKPANILVSEQAGEPTVKIIDFGLAKALDQPLIDEQPETGNRMLGTPAYMSPEALGYDGDNMSWDVRTDVYSLGVVLYELLAGVGPFKLEGSNLAIFSRRVLAEDAPSLGRRVSLFESNVRTKVAKRRQLDSHELVRRVRGELDWIVQRAIAKSPEDRYPSAGELADDLRRHLRNEPVHAGPQTWRYRLGKLARRHRLAVATIAFAALALIAAVIGTTAGLVRAQRAEKQARQEARAATQVTDFLVELFETSDPFKKQGQSITARELLQKGAERIRQKLADQPLLRARMMTTLGRVHLQLGLLAEAEPLLADALAIREQRLGSDHRDVAEVRIALGSLLWQSGRMDEGIKLIERGVAAKERLFGDRSAELYEGLLELGSALLLQGSYDRAEAALLRAQTIAELKFGPRSVQVAETERARGAIRAYQGKLREAVSMFRVTLAIFEREYGREHPKVARVQGNLSTMASSMGNYEESARLHKSALAIFERVLGESHPSVRTTLSNRGWALIRQGKYTQAEPVLARALKLDRMTGDDPTMGMASRLTNLGISYWKLGRLAEAEPLFHEANTIRDEILDPGHPHRATSRWGLANVYREQGRYEEAETLYKEALEIRANVLPKEHVELVDAVREYAVLLRMLDRDAEARALEARFAVSAKE